MKVRGMFLLILSICVCGFAVTSVFAATPKSYVLKHPKREHCKAHYTKKTRVVKKHRHKVKQTVCLYVAPKSPTKTESSTPAPTTTTTSAPITTTPTPISTTTTLTATPYKECSTVLPFIACFYTITYSTVNSKGEAAPGEIIIKEHVPPSQEERKVAIPSGAEVSVWASLKSGCSLNSTINKVEQPSYACESQNPREILVAEYIPASGYLASKSEPVTLQ